jgi:hypothetical protein
LSNYKPISDATLADINRANHDAWDASTPKNYEQKERAAIQGESKSKGSTSFNFGHNVKPKKSYEQKERAAIQGESRSKGSTSFKFGANKDANDPAAQGERAAKRDNLVSKRLESGASHKQIQEEIGMEPGEYRQTYQSKDETDAMRIITPEERKAYATKGIKVSKGAIHFKGSETSGGPKGGSKTTHHQGWMHPKSMRVEHQEHTKGDAYPKTLTPEQRKTVASNIKRELKGKTGQARKETRAEMMDPGPSDDSLVPSAKRRLEARSGSTVHVTGLPGESQQKKSEQQFRNGIAHHLKQSRKEIGHEGAREYHKYVKSNLL